MIRNGDLFNRINEGREVKSFSLWVIDPDPVDHFDGVMATFTHEGEDQWRVEMLFRYSPTPQAYVVHYAVPKRRAPLTLVAATGLANLMKAIDAEMNVKGEMMFAIGDLMDGAKG